MSAVTILIVDDNPVNLSVLRALLGREDYDLISAGSGQEALDLVAANPRFNLILLDVAMPDLNGIDVCRRLKADPVSAHIPIVLISALRTDDESIRQGLDAGADGYLAQPIEDIALKAWVKATLRISQLQQELHGRVAESSDEPLESLVSLFTNLSHGVNNPLQALYAAADMLALELPEDSPGQELVKEILVNAERVAQLVAEASLQAKNRGMPPAG